MPMIRAAALAATLLLLVGCNTAPAVTVGGKAPDYRSATIAGEPVSLADLRGEVVLLNLWATWCYPCRREMPSFEALSREFADGGLRVVAVSIDRAGAESEIREFLDEHGISFTILHDPDQQIVRTFRTLGVPETFLIDREGVLVRHWIGRIDGHSESVRSPIREALGSRLAAGG